MAWDLIIKPFLPQTLNVYIVGPPAATVLNSFTNKNATTIVSLSFLEDLDVFEKSIKPETKLSCHEKQTCYFVRKDSN